MHFIHLTNAPLIDRGIPAKQTTKNLHIFILQGKKTRISYKRMGGIALLDCRTHWSYLE